MPPASRTWPPASSRDSGGSSRLIALPLDAVYDARFIDATRRFLGAARDFDPTLGLDSAYQALRNVWIMNSLQFDLGLPVGHDDAVFAYSMVYPYLDNVLDDAGTSESGKLALLAKLRDWLEGAGPEAATPSEVRLLVARPAHRAPITRVPGSPASTARSWPSTTPRSRACSSRSRARPSSPDEVLAISLEKGGTSVLADGYLVAGGLRPGRRGILLRLRDVPPVGRRPPGHRRGLARAGIGRCSPTADGRARRRGRRRPARELPGRRRRAGPPRARRRARLALCDAIEGGLTLMFRESVGKHREHFGGRFVRRAKRGSPVRFSYLEKLRRRLEKGTPAAGARLADLDPGLVALMALSSRAFTLD
ncbi:MAG: hypothetical protein M0C28_03060 [Candidatus Moduliflexus flocculans]|nr:hypothetical protein [Candidatus Moduliflexus flocculans]